MRGCLGHLAVRTSLGQAVSSLLSVCRRGAPSKVWVWAYSTPNRTWPLWDPGPVPATVCACLKNTGVKGRGRGTSGALGPGAFSPQGPRLFCRCPARPCPGQLRRSGCLRVCPHGSPELVRKEFSRPDCGGATQVTWRGHVGGPHAEMAPSSHLTQKHEFSRDASSLPSGGREEAGLPQD